MNHAFRMKLKPGQVEEYRRRHDAIWPELAELLRTAGIYDYSIFLDEETLHLFAVLKLREPNQREQLPQHPVMRRWWDYMRDLMETHPDGRPREWPLRYSVAPFTATVRGLTPGRYEFRARAVDLNGFAQPEPRPLQKTGKNAIQVRRFEVG